MLENGNIKEKYSKADFLEKNRGYVCEPQVPWETG